MAKCNGRMEKRESEKGMKEDEVVAAPKHLGEFGLEVCGWSAVSGQWYLCTCVA